MENKMIESHRSFFETQKTKSIKFRKEALIRLKKEIVKSEDEISNALYQDFKKPRFESLATETQFVLSELQYVINKIDLWSKPERTSSNLVNFPSSSYIHSEPYGNVLIISPWNYPFLLSMSPLIGAITAGNTVVLKPSELTAKTSGIIAKIIKNVFEEDYVTVVEGGVKESQELLKQKWNYIFFTGSSRVGKIVYKSAAEHLTPVTLELSGKNPCIVDDTANIKLAAKRIVWGKFLNAGQTCIASDYILVHKNVKSKFIAALKENIIKSFGENIQNSKDFARICTSNHYTRLKEMLTGENVIFGGDFNDSERYISPTLVDSPSMHSKVMEDEIFGPILPILAYENELDLDKYISKYGKSLALYVFSTNKKFQKRLLNKYSFGGGVINDTVMQITNKKIPFGGVGNSGNGGYHGKHSFDLFSHKKSILKRANWLDVPLRYPPYKIPIQWVKKMKHLF
ncbi:aldehyde dehydrogenase [uncultured Croceitalea sp.]|uniref:aldehyde dehydrogenase n=1 Tax=uncultured Croceitalea sp. TaxID=1798908 RepID=UPI0033058F38